MINIMISFLLFEAPRPYTIYIFTLQRVKNFKRSTLPAHDNLLNFLRIGSILEGSGEYYAVGSKHARNTGARQVFIDKVTNTVRSTRTMQTKRGTTKDNIPVPKLEKLVEDSRIKIVGRKRQLTRLITE